MALAPIKWESKIILGKIETAYGADPTLTGAANAMLLGNVVVTPMEGDDVSRDLEQPFLGAKPSSVSALRARMTSRVELAPSGVVATAPAWAPMMLGLGCSMTINPGVSVVFKPESDAHPSVFYKFWIGSTLHAFKGSRGDATIRYPAQGYPYLETNYQGLWIQPTESARPTPALTAFKKPQIVTSANTPTFTLGGVGMVMREFSMALNNQVEYRGLVGREEIMIVDRAESAAARVEAVPLTTYDPYDRALNETPTEARLVHGTGAGRISTLVIPTAQHKRPGGFENAQKILEWSLPLTPLPSAGNDQWTFTLT